MIRVLWAGAAALAITAGAASAQTVYQESTTTIQPTVPSVADPVPGSVYKEKKTRVLNADGTESVKSETRASSASGGLRTTESSHTVTPNGSEVRSNAESVTSPLGDTTTSRTTTTIEKK